LRKILIVEDDLPMTRLLQTFLSLEGFQAVSTPQPSAVLNLARQEKPDLVVMDLHLGHVKTLSILAEFKSDPALKATPVIVVSGLEAEEECARAGADAFLLKPYSPNALVEMMKALVK
jgi:DNA-binding response OmpR family regulator